MTWRPHPHCPHAHHYWNAPDSQATEHEVTDFLQALVRLVKPTTVIETGTYHGRTTTAIAVTLRRNGIGSITTFETNAGNISYAEEQLQWLIDANAVTLVGAAATEATLPERIDLAFLDSCMECRDAEMQLVWPRVTPGGLVVVHDAAPQRPPGKVRPPGEHHMLEIATPRGLNVFQKPWPQPEASE